MTIYIDSDFKCHVSAADGLRAIETDSFDGKCKEWIESYRLVPAGETWVREDGVMFTGEMVSPWKDLSDAYVAQADYLEAKLLETQANIEEVDAALLDAEYKNIIGEEINE